MRSFKMNKEAVTDNKFIDQEFGEAMGQKESTDKAKEVHDRYIKTLKDNGIDVEVFEQTVEAADSIFPDWFITARNSFFPHGVLILSAMKHPE